MEERHKADLAEAERRLGSQIEAVREVFPREDLASKLDNDVFQALLEAGFPLRGEKAVLSALTTTMSERIVRDSEVRRLEDDLLRGIQVSVNGETLRPWSGRLDYISEEVARLEGVESLRRKLAALGGETSVGSMRGLSALVELLVAADFSYDSQATVAAKVRAASGVPKDSTETYQKGQAVLRAGEQVTPYALSVLGRMEETSNDTEGKRSVLGLVFFVLTGLLLLDYGRARFFTIVHPAERRGIFWSCDCDNPRYCEGICGALRRLFVGVARDSRGCSVFCNAFRSWIHAYQAVPRYPCGSGIQYCERVACGSALPG